jgi:hypothetical protein
VKTLPILQYERDHHPVLCFAHFWHFSIQKEPKAASVEVVGSCFNMTSKPHMIEPVAGYPVGVKRKSKNPPRRSEKAGVGGSIPSLGTLHLFQRISPNSSL